MSLIDIMLGYETPMTFDVDALRWAPYLQQKLTLSVNNDFNFTHKAIVWLWNIQNIDLQSYGLLLWGFYSVFRPCVA